MAENRTGQTTRSNEEIILLNQLGRQWLRALFSILRTSQFHESGNKIFDKPIRRLVQVGDVILERESHADFRTVEDQFFLNGLWIKPTLSEKENLFTLADYMQSLGLGGVVVRTTTSDANWRTFLQVYKATKAPPAERYKAINRALSEAKIEQIEIRRIVALKDDEKKDLPLPKTAYAAVSAYAKSVLVLREFTLAAPGEEQITVLRKAQRLICDLIDVAEKSPKLFLLLTLLKNFDSYFFHHCVNVAILSIALAKEIELGRKDLVDLGMAALLHDVGKLRIPEELLTKTEKLTPEEWNQIRHHPIDSAKIFLTLGYMNESVAERVLVGYQHHFASRAPNAYPQPRRSIQPSLMAEVIAICVTYDALTTDKTYRGSFVPFEVIRILCAESSRGRYRSDLLHAFVRMMGPLPIGSWVRTNDGREGLVAVAGTLAPNPPHPLLFCPDEEKAGKWINTSYPLPSSGKRPSLAPGRTDRLKYHRSLRALFTLDSEYPK